MKKTNININKVLLDITKLLPEGFYLYIPSFPHYRYKGKIYTQTDFVVPAIYTQGKKYEFIKPEQKVTKKVAATTK